MADQCKLRQNVGLENMNDVNLWRYKQRTPNTNDTIRHWMKPLQEKFLRTPLVLDHGTCCIKAPCVVTTVGVNVTAIWAETWYSNLRKGSDRKLLNLFCSRAPNWVFFLRCRPAIANEAKSTSKQLWRALSLKLIHKFKREFRQCYQRKARLEFLSNKTTRRTYKNLFIGINIAFSYRHSRDKTVAVDFCFIAIVFI